jgi:K+-sensing histidine kinase KdpD
VRAVFAAKLEVVTTDATELEAIVAHGLLNSLAVLSGAAATLLAYGRDMEDEDVATLVMAIDAQSGVFTEGLKVLLEHSTVAFADAATAISLGAAVCGSLSAERRVHVLTTLVKRSKELKSALDGLVRGLPPDVLELLDSLTPTAETGS